VVLRSPAEVTERTGRARYRVVMSSQVTKADIEGAAQLIRPHVRLTPVLDLGNILSDDWSLHLKLENLQLTGSFKVRGAFNLLLTSDVAAGLVAASGGNFGRAVAYAAAKLGIHATIFVPETSPPEKTGAIASYGAEVRLIPGFYDDALAASVEFATSNGAFQAHAYDQAPVVAGQGTIGSEIESQVAGVSSVLVAVGGGGLIGGIASWFRDEVDVIAVEPELSASLYNARAAGHPVPIEVNGIAVSSLGAKQVGAVPWEANRWIDQSLLVSEEAIENAQTWLWEVARIWVEPAAAVPIAALLTEAYVPSAGEVVVAVISGGNVALRMT